MEGWDGQAPPLSPPALGRGQGWGKCGKAHMVEELIVHWSLGWGSKVSLCWGPQKGGATLCPWKSHMAKENLGLVFSSK